MGFDFYSFLFLFLFLQLLSKIKVAAPFQCYIIQSVGVIRCFLDSNFICYRFEKHNILEIHRPKHKVTAKLSNPSK